jgi:hypothetical protein
VAPVRGIGLAIALYLELELGPVAPVREIASGIALYVELELGPVAPVGNIDDTCASIYFTIPPVPPVGDSAEIFTDDSESIEDTSDITLLVGDIRLFVDDIRLSVNDTILSVDGKLIFVGNDNVPLLIPNKDKSNVLWNPSCLRSCIDRTI